MARNRKTLELMKATGHPDYEKDKAEFDAYNRESFRKWHKKIAMQVAQLEAEKAQGEEK